MKGNGTPLPFLRNGVAQIAFVVKDIDRVVENYYHTFGIAPWHFYTYQAPLLKMMRYHGEERAYSMHIALTYFGPTRIELIEHLSGDTVYQDFIRTHGYGVQHLGVLVENMQEALVQVRRAGIAVLMEGAGFGKNGDGHYAYLDTEDALGVVYELIQRPSDRVPPEKVYPSPQ